MPSKVLTTTLSNILLLSQDDQFHKLETLGSLIVDWSKELSDIDMQVSHDMDMLLKLNGFNLCLLCLTVSQLNDEEEQALVDFVKSGNRLFAFHSASAVNENNTKYIDLLGARFITHSPYHEFPVTIIDKEHPVTKGIDDFRISDELYVLDREPKDVNVLATTIWENKTQPMVYAKKYGNGKVLYNALGHDEAAFNNPAYRQLTVQGIKWLIS
jgi:type 1 glutamine amidotransferase